MRHIAVVGRRRTAVAMGTRRSEVEVVDTPRIGRVAGRTARTAVAGRTARTAVVGTRRTAVVGTHRSEAEGVGTRRSAMVAALLGVLEPERPGPGPELLLPLPLPPELLLPRASPLRARPIVHPLARPLQAPRRPNLAHSPRDRHSNGVPHFRYEKCVCEARPHVAPRQHRRFHPPMLAQSVVSRRAAATQPVRGALHYPMSYGCSHTGGRR
ncbi:MAG: hypothetical protein JWQ64_897 [Subtercola sp.]|nr:hypothetical protein [Subtercola sp.]